MSSTVQDHGSRFEALKRALLVYHDVAQGSPATLDLSTQAAVSVVLRGTNDLDLLMIKRAHVPVAPLVSRLPPYKLNFVEAVAIAQRG